jgi:hypothetical protein
VPRKRIEVVLDARGDANVEAESKELYGVSDSNWDWVKRKLQGMDPDELKARCPLLKGRHPCRVIRLPPCYVFGQLKIEDEDAWREGLQDGLFTIEAVVHDDYARAYYSRQVMGVSEEDQRE